MSKETMTEVLIEMMNAERSPIPIREFVDGLRKAGYIESWERVNDEGTKYLITFATQKPTNLNTQ